MRVVRAAIVASLLGLLPGCSLLFDGSSYTGGTGDTDAGGTDGGPGDDAGSDAGAVSCDADDECSATESCEGGVCRTCDEDGDGWLASRCSSERAPDCDDSNAAIHPGATPICGNGVDESCAAGAGLDTLGLPQLDELGFFPTRDIQGPPDRPFRLRVRAEGGSPPRARVLWQIDDGRGTIMISDATIGAPTIASQPLHEYTSTPWPDGVPRLSYDLQHQDDLGSAALHAVYQDGSRNVFVRGVIFRSDGGWSNADAGSIAPPQQYGELAVVGDPAMIRTASGHQIGVVGTYLEGGSRRAGLFRIDPAANTFDLVSHEVTADARWSHSDGRAAVFPGSGGSIVVWNGIVSGSGDDAERIELAGALTGVPVVNTLRAPGAGNAAYTVALPQPNTFHLVRGECPTGSPLSVPECAFSKDAEYETGLDGAWMTLSSVRFSTSAFGAFWGDPGVTASALNFSVVETEPLQESIRPFRGPAPGIGNIQETAVHFDVTPLTGGAAITIVYAFIRGNGTGGRVSVGAVRACSGTGI